MTFGLSATPRAHGHIRAVNPGPHNPPTVLCNLGGFTVFSSIGRQYPTVAQNVAFRYYVYASNGGAWYQALAGNGWTPFRVINLPGNPDTSGVPVDAIPGYYIVYAEYWWQNPFTGVWDSNDLTQATDYRVTQVFGFGGGSFATGTPYCTVGNVALF
jgi:hypothetical protein